MLLLHTIKIFLLISSLQKNKALNSGLYSLKIFNLSVTGRKSVIYYLILFFIFNQVAADHFILAVDGEVETLYLTILKLYLFFIEVELLHEEVFAILIFLVFAGDSLL